MLSKEEAGRFRVLICTPSAEGLRDRVYRVGFHVRRSGDWSVYVEGWRLLVRNV